MFEIASPLTMRQAQETDKAFFKQLYATTRDDLRQMPVSPQKLAQVIEMQQEVQENGLRDVYPGAVQWTIQLEQNPIGRLIVDYSQQHNDWRVIDIALLPQYRRQGYGRQVMQAVMSLARQSLGSVSLAVFGFNDAAYRLYSSLDFQVIRKDKVHAQMIWRSAA